jgi:hypothetical protein
MEARASPDEKKRFPGKALVRVRDERLERVHTTAELVARDKSSKSWKKRRRRGGKRGGGGAVRRVEQGEQQLRDGTWVVVTNK